MDTVYTSSANPLLLSASHGDVVDGICHQIVLFCGSVRNNIKI